MCQSQGIQLRGVTPIYTVGFIPHALLWRSPRTTKQTPSQHGESEPSRHASSAFRSSPGGRVAHKPSLPRRSCAPPRLKGRRVVRRRCPTSRRWPGRRSRR